MSLDLDAQRLLMEGTRRRRYVPGAVIIREGDVPASLYWLAEGQASVRLSDWRGHEVILSYVNQGEFFGEMCLCPDTTTRTAMVRAIRECLVVELPFARFRSLAAQQDSLWLALVGQLAQHLRETSRRLVDTALLRVPERVLETLHELAADVATDAADAPVRLRVTRQELGDLVGCTREVAGRALRQLAAERYIQLDGRTIVIRQIRNCSGPA